MLKPILSLCIPTYRRAHLLREVLDHLDQADFLPFPFEVLVVNNATPDDSYAWVDGFRPANYRLSYLVNPTNIGMLPNYFGALRRAQGEFVLNLADDDRLDPNALADAVLNMLADPGIVATQCCWRDHDLVSGETAPPAIPFNNAVFPPARAGELVRSYLHTRFMPEIAVYRSSALARCLFSTELFFWPFAMLERLFRLGTVRVSGQPFYLTVSRRADEPFPRSTGGDRFTFLEWESINRSFEFLTYRYSDIPEDGEANVHRREINWVRSWYLDQACIQHFKRGEFLPAYELAALLAARKTPSSIMGDELKANLCQLASLSAMLATLAWMPEVTHLGVTGFDRATEAGLIATLRHLAGPDTSIAIEAGNGSDKMDALALLVPTEADRQTALDRGIIQGKIFSLESLGQIFSF